MEVTKEAFHLRELDVDDLIVMHSLLRGVNPAGIAKLLSITQPAVSHRRKKYENIFPGFYTIEKRGSVEFRILSDYGKKVCKKMERALAIMLEGPNDK